MSGVVKQSVLTCLKLKNGYRPGFRQLSLESKAYPVYCLTKAAAVEKEGKVHIPSLPETADENTNAHLVADASPLGTIALQYVPERIFKKHHKTQRSHNQNTETIKNDCSSLLSSRCFYCVIDERHAKTSTGPAHWVMHVPYSNTTLSLEKL